MEVAAGAEGEVPVTGPVGGAKALPVRAGEGQQVRPRPTARGGPAAGPGRRRTGKGQPGVADAASAVPGSGARAWGWDLHLPTRAAPRSPLGGEGRGRGNRPQRPAEAPAPPLQPLPPHSPARAFLFRSPSAPVSMVTASGRSPRLRPLGGLPAPFPPLRSRRGDDVAAPPGTRPREGASAPLTLVAGDRRAGSISSFNCRLPRK